MEAIPIADILADTCIQAFTKHHFLPPGVEAPGKNFSDHEFSRSLQKQMNKLKQVQTSNHTTKRHDRVLAALSSTTHMFVCRDAKAPPLTRPYMGPFTVISKQEKYFEFDLNGKRDQVSIDCLKPAFIESESERDSAIICYGPRKIADLLQK